LLGHGRYDTAVRLIRSGALDPARNLALDEALLRSGRETLRLYAWEPPGLSIGYFQRARDFAVPAGFTLVRRPTGGGAIAHTGEVTVAWVGRRRRVESVYAATNAWVRRAVARLGIAVEAGSGEPEAAPAGLCFDAHTSYDLLAGGRKLFGSAQRRGGDRFLMHGTLVVKRNPLAAGAVSLEELIGRTIAREEVEAHLIAAATELWNEPLAEEPPTGAEKAAAEALLAERYAADSWTHRR
jgi:lipoate-protein ligase A